MLLITLRPVLVAATALAMPLSLVEPPPVPVQAPITQQEPTVLVGPDLRAPLLDLPDDVREALRIGAWARAADGLRKLDIEAQPGRRKGTLAFLTAWSLVHAGRAAEARNLVDRLDGDGVPSAWADLVRGEVAVALKEPLQALPALENIPEDSGPWARAQLVRAQALRELGRTQDAFAVYEALAAQPDPSPGVPEALLALAGRAKGSDAAYAQLRRLWEQYPKTDASRAGWAPLQAYGRAPSTAEQARRAYVLMEQGAFDEALSESAGLTLKADDRSDEACQLLFARGRSHYKRNRLSASIEAFSDIGARCTDASDDWGARGLYLQGTARFRKREYRSAASTFLRIPKAYPKSSYADDGYLHAGIALQEADDIPAAQEAWRKALDEIPAGDTTPESTWRLAWTQYLEGAPEQAVETAERLGELPLEGDRRHVEAGRYWAARWRLYPDVDQPTVALESPGPREEAIAGWRDLCRELPHSYYAIIAYSRLVEVAPEVAAELARRPADHQDATAEHPWEVRLAFLDDPEVRAGVDLARMGLIREARAAWDHAEVSAERPDEVAFLTELRIQAGDWLFAHDAMRSWMNHHPPGTLGPSQPWVLRVGYPDRYWPEVQEAAPSYRYEPRLFHALVREESNFNRNIRSHAGAIGLSQLMPYTAKQTAGWLGRGVGDLDDPLNNLQIGGKYLDVVHGQLAGSPFLALAGYNAGPARVQQWLGEWGNVPTDEFVERIPFRETRGYVRRVTTTWQTYRYQFDQGPAFPDLSRYNHEAMPGVE